MVTNLPVLVPLFKRWLCPFLKSSLRFLSNHGDQSGGQGGKLPEGQLGDKRHKNGRHQKQRTHCPFFHASRSVGSGIRSVWSTRVSGLYHPPTRTLDVDPNGSRVSSGAEYVEADHGPIASRQRDIENGDEAAFNRTESGDSDGIITPVPPCKIRKVMEVSVEEGKPAPSSYGNFTSVWGRRRNPPGPDGPVGMRTPYLMDHLQPMKPGTESRESSYTTKLIG